MERDDAGFGFLLTDDMIFSSRITGTARALGLDIKPARSVQILKALAQEQVPTCFIIDLANPGLQIDELIKDLRQLVSPMPRVVAYGSDVDTCTLRSARQAGHDPGLPRAKVVLELTHKLPT